MSLVEVRNCAKFIEREREKLVRMNLTFELLVYFGSAFAAALPWNDPKPSFSWHDTKYLYVLVLVKPIPG